MLIMNSKGFHVMSQFEFKKFPIAATILTVVGLLLAVISITSALMLREDYYFGGPIFLGLLLLVANVLFLAGITTGKINLLRVISIVSYVGIIIANFALTIAKYGARETELFTFAILMLITCILSYVYFLAGKSKRIRTMFIVAIGVLVTLTVAYAISYIMRDVNDHSSSGDTLMTPYYLILFSYAILPSIPLAIRCSLSKKEQTEEFAEEEVDINDDNDL